MKNIVLLLSTLFAAIISIGVAIAADNPPTDKAQVDAVPANAAPADAHSADEAAIRASGAKFIEAYNARDAKKLAALWSPEAVYIDPLTGEQTVGRDAIENVFADAFADKQDVKLSVDGISIEFVSPNVAIVRGVAHVIRPGEEPVDSDFTSVRVKQDGQWLIDRVSEVEKEKTPPSNYEHLKELQWMIGSWHDNDPRPAVEIQTDCAWTKNKNFITRSFAVEIGDQIRKSGMQIIGWDPVAKQIHSWVFDSDGGFGEGTWTHKGNQWFIQNTGTLPDGGKATTLNIMTRLDDDSFKWESVNRDIDGTLQPDVDPVLVVRKTAP
ncbi:MAG TPA: SgcJ/EcaC family oxidoreductase [Pirellulales bacterium]|nr:SgcJ/EcaC family oxidoreductase [Pirellulales bacterium]